MIPEYPLVREFMDVTFVKLTPEMPLYEAVQLFLKHRITGAVVVDPQDERRLVGVLSEKDCLHTVVHGAYNNVPMGIVADYMSANVMTIGPELDVMAVANDFLKHVYRRFPVTDEDGRLVGRMTRRDLLRAIHSIMGEDWSAEHNVG